MALLLFLTALGDQCGPTVINADEPATDVGSIGLCVLFEPDELTDQAKPLSAVRLRPGDAPVCGVVLSPLPVHVPCATLCDVAGTYAGRDVVPQPVPYLASKGAILVGETQVHAGTPKRHKGCPRKFI